MNETDGWKIVDGLEVENCQYVDKPNFGWIHWDTKKFNVEDEIELIGVHRRVTEQPY